MRMWTNFGGRVGGADDVPSHSPARDGSTVTRIARRWHSTNQ